MPSTNTSEVQSRQSSNPFKGIEGTPRAGGKGMVSMAPICNDV